MDDESEIIEKLRNAHDEVDKYLESLSYLTDGLASHSPDLSLRCAEFSLCARGISSLILTQNWSRIFDQLCASVSAIAGEYEIDLEAIKRHQAAFSAWDAPAVKSVAYAFICSSILDFVLSPISSIVGFFLPKRCKAPLVLHETEAEVVEAFKNLQAANDKLKESLDAVHEADKEPELPPDQPSVVKQEAFNQFNESFTKIVIGLAPTIKINDGAAVALPQQNYTFILKGNHESVGDGAANISFVVSPKLKNPGSQMEKHAKYCKYIVDCLEDWRRRIRDSHRGELEHGLTKCLSLPSLQHIADWIAKNKDQTVTRRIVNTALFNALGTTINSYALMRNAGRQAAQERQQAIDSKANAHRSAHTLNLKKYPISKDIDRLNANIIMYWEKLPTQCDFVLLDHKPTVSEKFDREKYLNGLRTVLQSL